MVCGGGDERNNNHRGYSNMTRRETLAAFIRTQRAAYVEQSDGECEVSDTLRRLSGDFRRWEETHGIGGHAVHHIWTRETLPGSWFCGMVLVSTCAHEWGHQAGGAGYRVPLAFEAACLDAKWRLHRQRLWLPIWRWEPDRIRLHWDVDAFDEVRRSCRVGWVTMLARCEFLADELRSSPFGALAAELVKRVQITGR